MRDALRGRADKSLPEHLFTDARAFSQGKARSDRETWRCFACYFNGLIFTGSERTPRTRATSGGRSPLAAACTLPLPLPCVRPRTSDQTGLCARLLRLDGNLTKRLPSRPDARLPLSPPARRAAALRPAWHRAIFSMQYVSIHLMDFGDTFTIWPGT